MNPFNRLALGVGLALIVHAQPGLCLSSDRNESITIVSDTAERDEQKGTTTYSGAVVMQQGSMRIEAEKVVIFDNKNKVIKIVANGNPARYQQKPNADDGLVVANAARLEYDIAQETLHLIDGASLTQEGTSLSGNRIDYDVKQSVVKAGGDERKNERVRMVIPARALKSDDSE
jgi:lipopolysaccharide export system protein LptA